MTPAQMAALHANCFTYPRPWTVTEFTAHLENPHVVALSRRGGVLLGQSIAGEAEILTLAVDPSRRRAGLGFDLVGQFLHHVRADGASRVFLEVAANNCAAISLYEKSGFFEAGHRRDYYSRPDGSREDAIILTRDL